MQHTLPKGHSDGNRGEHAWFDVTVMRGVTLTAKYFSQFKVRVFAMLTGPLASSYLLPSYIATAKMGGDPKVEVLRKKVEGNLVPIMRLSVLLFGLV